MKPRGSGPEPPRIFLRPPAVQGGLAVPVTITLALLALLGSGCAASRPAAKHPVVTTQVAPPPPPPQEPAGPPSGVPTTSMLVSPIAEEPRGDGGLISFSVKNVDVKDVLLGLSRLSRSNIVFEQDLTGKVSVDLKEVTIEEALDSLAAPLGLEWSRTGRTIYVTKQKVQTRIFPLNYIPTRRKSESQVSATSGSGTSSSSAAAATGATPGAETSSGFSRVKAEDTSNLWDDVRVSLERLLSPQGRYSINPMAGIVVVTDFPAQLDRVAQYFAAVETSVRRQVVIQAEILEIVLTDDFEYGIDISYLRKTGTFKGSKPGLFPKADPNRTGSAAASDAGPKRTLISQLLNPGTGVFSIGLMDLNLSVVLDLLQTEGRLRTLSRPSVSALNNQKAIIKVATDDVFFDIKNTVGLGGTTTPEVTSTTVSIGVILSVTPQIASDGYIVMDVHPIVTDAPTTRSITTGGVSASRPVVDVRETNTVLRVRDGESIVIAGLVKTKDDRQVKRVPFLSDIPVLGVLFKQIDESKRNTELLIKITPRIVQTTP